MTELEFLGSAERSIGTLYLSRYPDGSRPDGWVYAVYIDGDLLMSSVSPLSERELATRAIAAHPGKSLRILIGGLGLGYTAQAALESDRSGLVRVVDRMDFVIGWLKDGLLPLSKQLTEDPRMDFVQSDVYGDLMGPATETYDLILVDVDHAPDDPLDPASLPFYTPEGLAKVQQHLAPGGILAVWSAHPNGDFEQAMATRFQKSWTEAIAWRTPEASDGGQDLHNTLFFGTGPQA